ncbi:hypothetical protein B0H17DRAFT_1287383 [Mycena rosella]|uniref:Ubiquitin-like protease family profile domain-containing protein n=1 Tax=Mycena rosella TaxID=1033263 RepID=A0AAD7GWH8_MYCRO|nr:hypothetical protein B0H17DRAFT_1287383 [Mycena rosella]
MASFQPRLPNLAPGSQSIFWKSIGLFSNALAAALHTIYDRRGFRVMSTRNRGQLAKDPFREGLAQAVQWYSNLRTKVQTKLADVLATAELSVLPPIPTATSTLLEQDGVMEVMEVMEASGEASAASASSADSIDALDSGPANSNEPTPGRAHRILRERCPACFGLETWGRPLTDGGDVQLSADGCFSYRHLRSAGDGPISYDPSYFISKEKVANIRARIANARRQKPAKVTPPIPQEAIDACQASWDAANEKKQKVDPKRHDASGVFVMTCRHSQVLFLCNIDTPGERQEYIVALMEEANSLLPPQATVIQAYDVGCVTDHSLNLVNQVPCLQQRPPTDQFSSSQFSVKASVCQMVYSPRLRRGLGLTDAEGVERFWSRIRKLIGITRNQWNSRRIWMIDQYAAFVNEEGRDGLGTWIHRQESKNLPQKRVAARKVLKDCGVSESELRRNWQEQKASQTSVRSHAPVYLRRELDKVLALQTQIDSVEKSIADVKQSITAGSDASSDSIILLRSLERTHETLNSQAEALYASLNIQGSFPELQNLPLEFVRTLLMMRDLKINIRKRAVGSFYEWENLDRAVGGRREALGTKLHQSTRKAISKRQPALLRSIAKFNSYCADLERLRPSECKIPIPPPLSTQLNSLRDDPSLHEDVWITPAEGQIPRWLNDVDVRDGIRALHAADRCAEEASRLNTERASMTTWLIQELSIVAVAMSTLTDPTLTLELQLRLEQLQFLRLAWQSVTTARPMADAEATATWHPCANISVSTHSEVPIPPETATIDSEFDDELFGEDFSASDMLVASEELDPGSISDTDHDDVLILQEMLENSEVPEESTTGEADSLNQIFLWIPDFYSIDGRPNVEMEASDIARVESRTGRLTGFALNGLAAALVNFLGHPVSPNAATANQCAVFSTYDLPRIRYRASDDDLWRHINHTKYWEKNMWLIPIHRIDEQHWVLAGVIVDKQQIFFFDSLSVRGGGWRRDIQDVMVLITRLVVLANRHKYPLYVSTEEDTWIARLLFNVYARENPGNPTGMTVGSGCYV